MCFHLSLASDSSTSLNWSMSSDSWREPRLEALPGRTVGEWQLAETAAATETLDLGGGTVAALSAEGFNFKLLLLITSFLAVAVVLAVDSDVPSLVLHISHRGVLEEFS